MFPLLPLSYFVFEEPVKEWIILAEYHTSHWSHKETLDTSSCRVVWIFIFLWSQIMFEIRCTKSENCSIWPLLFWSCLLPITHLIFGLFCKIVYLIRCILLKFLDFFGDWMNTEYIQSRKPRKWMTFVTSSAASRTDNSSSLFKQCHTNGFG